MKIRKNIKAEDILADDEDSSGDDAASEQIKLAEIIKNTIRSTGRERMTNDEKINLWEKIERGKGQHKPYSLPLWTRIAASVIIVLGILLWQFTGRSTGDLRKYAKQTTINNYQGETRLVLAAGKVLSLKGDPSIVYNSNKLYVLNNSSASVKANLNGLAAFNILLVPYGRRSQLTLEDGTKVWLNSGSRLIYPVSFDRDKREVYLEGEAYFKVSHNTQRPFYVQSKNISIKVLGTEFNITAYPDDKKTYTALVNGSIQLSATGGWFRKESRKLVPGDLAIYDPGNEELKMSQVNTEGYTSWKDGYMLLEQVPLKAIIKKLGRYYNLSVEVEPGNGNGETFSGRLDLQKNIEDVMDIICAGTDYKYDSLERRLTLKK